MYNLLLRKLSKTQCCSQTSKSSPVPTRTGQSQSGTATPALLTSQIPRSKIAAHFSSLLGQQLRCCQWRWHTVPGGSTFGRRHTQWSMVKISKPQGRHSAHLRKHQLGHPAIERRNKAGREKFSTVSNCCLHKTHFAKSINAALLQGLHYSHAERGMFQAAEAAIWQVLLHLFVQCLHRALLWVVSRCFWSIAVK